MQRITRVERLVARWAPLVWLSPGERFMPAGVEDFLQHVTPVTPVVSKKQRARTATAAGLGGSRARRGGSSGSSRTSTTAARVGRAAAAAAPGSPQGPPQGLPQGPRSAAWYLVSNASVDELLSNSSSFLYGRDPSRLPVPVYAVVTLCDEARLRPKLDPALDRDDGSLENNELPVADAGGREAAPLLHVTYWMFFPYNEGKPVCVLDLGPLGPWPLPLLWGSCMGSWKHFGAHVGDWEHVSLSFSDVHHPDAMYVSTHEAGGFYRWSGAAAGAAGAAPGKARAARGARGGHLVLERQEVRKGSELLQRASFPPVARLHRATGRPELFAAQGSHGLWTRPGDHRYIRVPRLYDHSG
ncbi:hypothetical protein FOCC_FOCC003776 [Frankliniella occidentalis]|nr:hypothetical protein FOCC_FOCC003776 [Frankliniella occidentalis]